MSLRPVGLISFDVEEWFHVLDSDVLPPFEAWDAQVSRAPRNVGRILDLLEARGARCTFFVLGWFAQRHPDVVRAIHRRGHEIASHSFRHPLLYQLDRAAVLDELVAGKDAVEQVIGERIAGFRAPGFSIRRENRWALDCVAEAGFVYDSSVFPASRAHGGMPGARPEPHRLTTPSGHTLVEIPVSVLRVAGRSIPFGGGGYFRLAPLSLTLGLALVVGAVGRPLVSYIHPRDIDPNTPRLPLGRWRTFKFCVGLRSAEEKLERLLSWSRPQRYIDYIVREFGDTALVVA